MVRRYTIQRHSQADRRTGLLALSVDDRAKEESACLTDEELAALVDNVCSRKEKGRYLKHLAHCVNCYQHWVELAEVAAAEEKQGAGNNVHKLFRPRNFAWAGSFLAAAASVVLFLNIIREAPPPIVHRPLKTMVERKSVPPSEPRKESSSVNSMSVPIEEGVDKLQDTTTYGARSPGDLPPSAPAMKMTDHAAEDYVQTQSTAVKKKLQVSRESGAVPHHRSKAIPLKQSRFPDQLWLDKVKQGCLHHETSRKFWVKQYRAGKQLTSFQSPEEKQLIKELLSLINQLQRKGGGGQSVCEHILKRFEAVSSE